MMSTKQAFFKKLNKVIQQNISNSNLSIEVLAEKMNLSRSQLHRLLKGFSNLSASNYVRLYRIKIAAKLLQQPNVVISQVAYRVGFRNLSYFSKSFKEVFDQTPAEYRDVHNK
ncbi:MAG: helix-turn-helix transcriptional regulator [Chitinophagales bacterium]